jgi:hypothetical protein
MIEIDLPRRSGAAGFSSVELLLRAEGVVIRHDLCRGEFAAVITHESLDVPSSVDDSCQGLTIGECL